MSDKPSFQDYVRAAISVVVIMAAVVQVVVQQHVPDPWIQAAASVFIGYYFGLAVGVKTAAIRALKDGGK